MIDHRQIDERSLAFGKLLAEKLSAKPSILDVARANLARWLVTCSPDVRSTLMEWSEIVDGLLCGIIEVMTGLDLRCVRLRQSNPFAGELTMRERNEILPRFRSHETPRT